MYLFFERIELKHTNLISIRHIKKHRLHIFTLWNPLFSLNIGTLRVTSVYVTHQIQFNVTFRQRMLMVCPKWIERWAIPTSIMSESERDKKKRTNIFITANSLECLDSQNLNHWKYGEIMENIWLWCIFFPFFIRVCCLCVFLLLYRQWNR